MEKKEFKRLFPHLAEEMETNTSKVDLKDMEQSLETDGPKIERKFNNYQPEAVDFIRRCKSNRQAEEIIDFLEGKGEIVSEEAEKLRIQLKEKGLRSFGSYKEPGFYDKEKKSL